MCLAALLAHFYEERDVIIHVDALDIARRTLSAGVLPVAFASRKLSDSEAVER